MNTNVTIVPRMMRCSWTTTGSVDVETHATFVKPRAWCWPQALETLKPNFWGSYLQVWWSSAMQKTGTGWAWTGIWTWRRSSTLCRIPWAHVCTGWSSQWRGSAENMHWNRLFWPDMSWDCIRIQHWTDHFAATGVVYGEVVHHLRVQSCHVNLGFFVVWPITSWPLHSYDGTVVLNFNRDHWRTKTSCMKRQMRNKCQWLGSFTCWIRSWVKLCCFHVLSDFGSNLLVRAHLEDSLLAVERTLAKYPCSSSHISLLRSHQHCAMPVHRCTALQRTRLPLLSTKLSP